MFYCLTFRDVITAAPVPIGAVKKHGFGLSQQQQQTQKRQPSNQQTTPQNAPSVRSKSPAVRNHSLSSNISSVSSESHGAGYASGTQKMNKESSATMKASSDMNYRGSLNNTGRDSDKSSLQGTKKRNMIDANGAKIFGSSCTPSNSCAENELRERATTIVQGVCESSFLEAKQEFKENDDRSCLVVPGNNNGLTRNEKSELSRSLTTIDQANQMTNNSDKTANVPSLNPQIKVLHTVQGTEALALRLEALRLQSVNSTAKPSSNPEAAANITPSCVFYACILDYILNLAWL
ncbi:unnamed protein product [Schistosoma rodhaini]|uniref:Uncharacterized protein n=1 Tax=Schistosoma rodhaini TaxID=6188 RepID=A0AA85F670_9TREM|nr:unnamed protein product [Schistosoma rodhaini]